MTQPTLQHMEALAKGNEVRYARAEDKRAIFHGHLDPTTILRNPPEHWKSAPVVMLLVSMQRVGRHKAMRWLNIERISPETKIGCMSLKRRDNLARHLDTWIDRRDDLRRQMDRAA